MKLKWELTETPDVCPSICCIKVVLRGLCFDDMVDRLVHPDIFRCC